MNETISARWLRWCLTAIAVLLAVIAIELSVSIRPFTPSAQAQIPDSGMQRNQLLEAQRQTNAKLDAILKHLRTQTIKVKVLGTDKEAKRRTQGAKGTTAQKPRAAKK